MGRIARITLVAWALSVLTLPGYGQSSSPANPLRDAMEMNVAEISLAKLAQVRTADSRVKSFANMMVKDHTEALSKLGALPEAPPADMKPGPAHQADVERLSKLSGADFDRQYIEKMVGDHKEALIFFETQSKQKTPLGKVADKLKSTVRKHLQQAQQLQLELSGAIIHKPANVYSDAGTAPRPLSIPPPPPPPAQ